MMNFGWDHDNLLMKFSKTKAMISYFAGVYGKCEQNNLMGSKINYCLSGWSSYQGIMYPSSSMLVKVNNHMSYIKFLISSPSSILSEVAENFPS